METQAKRALEHRYHLVCNQIHELAGSLPRPELLVVTKGHGPEPLRELFSWGQTAFGENYAQELIAKSEALGDLPVRWVFIGHLQSNKIRKIVSVASEIQTVGSLKHAEQIARAARDCGKIPYPIWIEVNADLEEGKHGCPLDEVPALAKAVAQNPDLHLRGLMAIPPSHFQDATTPEVPPLYTSLRRLADQVGEGQLSLGMSGDLGLSIRAGSNLVRIGTAILGPRQV
ncbi:MAG TPA: YggS family pyridoxal phosphate-dependent enzyme [Oligoflexus sp.]|uniref:YggS family pyridoxal phosphate-dependent enzyme n=1 Tax=Oligoflexus sp. TaxID=1971216 RepID=UPI002D2EA284|nr:YggS family pyridoxal phosphate-dependent enzyme [Oligoflexus sp.]HYX36153.1 YggS family pyridoxal phosphate-dependent enzyme [Oligoflexus sp.]